jgi:Fe-S-cluster containining protein
MCGNCCSGPPGYVRVSDAEAAALARRFNLPLDQFLATYTNNTAPGGGRSLNEKPSDFGLDCIFLDRTTIPGKAICSVYENRPAQCKTWPYWKSNLATEKAWERAKRICPGIDQGTLTPVQQIRVLRDIVEI